MGKIIDTKQGTRGCAFNDRFNIEYILAEKQYDLFGYSCLDNSDPEKSFLERNTNYSASRQISSFEKRCCGTSNLLYADVTSASLNQLIIYLLLEPI